MAKLTFRTDLCKGCGLCVEQVGDTIFQLLIQLRADSGHFDGKSRCRGNLLGVGQ